MTTTTKPPLTTTKITTAIAKISKTNKNKETTTTQQMTSTKAITTLRNTTATDFFLRKSLTCLLEVLVFLVSGLISLEMARAAGADITEADNRWLAGTWCG